MTITVEEAKKKQLHYEYKRRRRSLALALNNMTQNAKILSLYCNPDIWDGDQRWKIIRDDVDDLVTSVMAIELKIITLLGNIYEKPGDEG